MPKNKKPAGGRPAKNFDPRYGSKTGFQDRKRRPGESSSATARPGSKSPNHRGYRADEQAAEAPKRRWSAQEKAGRDEARGIRQHTADGGRGSYRDDRHSFEDRGERRPYGDRDQRPSYGDRTDRPARGGERPSYRDRGDRPAYGDRGDRPAYGDRAERRPYGERSERPSYGDRAERRPARDRDDRPSYRDRGERPAYGQRSERPAYGDRDQRPSYGDRAERRPARDRDERPAYGDRGDRPSFGDRAERRPYGERSERPSYGDRAERRPARDRDDRPSYRDRGDRPSFGDRDRRDDRAPRTGDRRDARPRRDDAPNRADWNAKPARFEEHVDVVHERLEAQAVEAETVEGQGFAELGLGQNIVKALAELGAAAPFAIQAATIGPILAGRDVLARGRTGSGKTIAFGAPLVESILRAQAGSKREYGRAPKAIILAPTRELALQIDRTVQPIARSVGLFTTQIYGGVPQARQVGALKKGVDIIIGTPGRIEDLIEQGRLDLSEVSIAVLDEADHMCELGFVEPVQRILRRTAEGSQKLLFSATLDREVAALVDEFLVEPEVYEVAGETQESGTIDHRVLVIDHRDKAEVVTSLVDREGKTLVFARTRAYAEMLAESFDDAGIPAVALHGDLNQAKRTRNLQRLTDGKVRVLVATDVAARGIHVDDIDLVVQADAPDEYKTYLHRSGRTGRAGRSGTVVTLITRQRRRRMTEMLERAEINAPFEDARPGDDLIEELAGRQLAEVDA
jgi:superfamily II DNA/RNA helicase